MTDDDIKRIARETGLDEYVETLIAAVEAPPWKEISPPDEPFHEVIIQFACAVAKHERDTLRALCLEAFEDCYGHLDDAERIASEVAARDTVKDLE